MQQDLRSPLPPPGSAPPWATDGDEYDAKPLAPPSMLSPASLEMQHGVPLDFNQESDNGGAREFLRTSDGRP